MVDVPLCTPNPTVESSHLCNRHDISEKQVTQVHQHVSGGLQGGCEGGKHGEDKAGQRGGEGGDFKGGGGGGGKPRTSAIQVEDAWLGGRLLRLLQRILSWRSQQLTVQGSGREGSRGNQGKASTSVLSQQGPKAAAVHMVAGSDSAEQQHGCLHACM